MGVCVRARVKKFSPEPWLLWNVEIWAITMGPGHKKTLETAFSGRLADPAICIN